MASHHRRSLLVAPLLLGALLGLCAPPAGASDGAQDLDVGSEVARLFADAAVATRQYEEGHQAAEAQRARVHALERSLDKQRQEIQVLHGDLGKIARAQYRTGGGLPYTARLLLTDDPEKLLESQQAVRQADFAVSNAISRSQRAENRLAADERAAASEWQAVEQRNARLAALRTDIERKLKDAQGRLQSQAERSVTAGQCRGAVRLEQDEPRQTRPWVAPVDQYVLSAGFGGSGARWANRHTGQDFAVDIGTPVRVVGAGRVVSVSCSGAFGIEVVVRHPNGYYTQYAHLSSAAVDEGESVQTGQWIGLSGTTGNSTGPHLHFEVRLTPQLGSSIDPVPWLAARGVQV